MKVKDAAMQAYPFIEPEENDNIKTYHPGMTMRDEFAKAALQGLLACPQSDGFKNEFAVWAYEYADEMMKERKKC